MGFACVFAGGVGWRPPSVVPVFFFRTSGAGGVCRLCFYYGVRRNLCCVLCSSAFPTVLYFSLWSVRRGRLIFCRERYRPAMAIWLGTNDSEIQTLSGPEWLENPSLPTPAPPTSSPEAVRVTLTLRWRAHESALQAIFY